MAETLDTSSEKKPNLGNDFIASIVVFLVALPLCVGISIASGVDPAAGLITGIVGGLIVGPLSGCPLQISGPAAGLVVIVAQLIHDHGLEKLGVIIVLAGLIQLVAGALRFAKWFRAVPPSVVHGMLSGIGILIMASQFHVMVDDVPRENGIQNLISIPMALYKGLSISMGQQHFQACCLGLTTILLLVLWNKLREKADNIMLKTLPPSLVAILAASIIAFALKLKINFVQLPSDFSKSLHFVQLDSISSFLGFDLLIAGLTVAFIAAAETLLTATAVDKMHKGERTNYDRELRAQGIGNIVCGFIGGLPMTGVMVRSGVNVSAGAKTRASAFFHGMWLLLVVSLLPFVVELIPKSALAALLVFTGWKLANVKVVKQLRKHGKIELYVYALTVLVIVSFDLLIGVLVGIALSLCKLLYIFTHLGIRTSFDNEKNRADLYLLGTATFLSLPRLAEALEEIHPGTELHVHLDSLNFIDHACLELIMSWEEKHVSSGGHLVIEKGLVEKQESDKEESSS